MTYEMMMALLVALGDDVSFRAHEAERHFDVTIEDFDGFDDDWAELDREYDDPEAVERFEEMLETESQLAEGDYYRLYHFEGFTVQLGFASMDV